MTANDYLKSIQDNFDGIEKNLKVMQNGDKRMINERYERELRNTSINDVSLADYVKENYIPKRTGHWIESRCDMYECSECDHIYTDLSGERYGMHYCPNCGACMKDCRTLDEFIEDSKESEE